MKEALELMKMLDANFKPKFDGFAMTHSYRGKNLAGNTRIGHYRFYLDNNLKVINAVDIGENSKEVE